MTKSSHLVRMQKQPLLRWISYIFFLLLIPAIYFFWDWGAAKFVTDSLHPPVTVTATRLGTKAPEFLVPKERIWSQKDFRLSQLHGYPVILHFWATWCGPCLQELPELIQLSDRLRPKGYSIVAIAIDESWAVLDDFFRKNPQLQPLRDRMVLVLDPNAEIANLFGSTKFPETFLINRQLVIDNKFTGAQPWNDAVMSPYLEHLTKD